MPTGYTAKIADGISFREFAMDCARAFGACIEIRDEPGGGEAIPEKFEPSDYHDKRLAEARAERTRIFAMSAEETEVAAEAAWNAAETRRLERLAGYRALRSRYEAMLADVDAWKPPTIEHAEMRTFMRDQITQSINFDCNESYADTPEKRLTGSEWWGTMLAKADRDIEYHAREAGKERERAASRTKWVANLRASLPA